MFSNVFHSQDGKTAVTKAKKRNKKRLIVWMRIKNPTDSDDDDDSTIITLGFILNYFLFSAITPFLKVFLCN